MTDNNGGGLPSTHHPFYKFNRHRKYARGQTNKGTLKFGSSCGKYSATEFTLVGRVQEHEDREKEGKLNGIEICRAVFLVARITFGRRPLSHWGGHVDNKEPLFVRLFHDPSASFGSSGGNSVCSPFLLVHRSPIISLVLRMRSLGLFP